MINYPIKFTPIFKYRIWGGEKLRTELKKKYSEFSIGESWELSDVDGDESVVSNGDLAGSKLRELIKKYRGQIVGESVYKNFGNEFPLLIKFIDAKTPLSIQVHPSNEIAKERHNSFGKNEMWYVMESEKESELIVGFNKKLDQDTYVESLKSGKILDILNTEKVKKGDAFYIPTGRVHAIGAGVLLAEIQQTSDITYRIYDYDRIDSQTGKSRELHTELALDVIDYDFSENYKADYVVEENCTKELVHSPYFKSNIILLLGSFEKNYSNLDSFVIYICVEGSFKLTYNNIEYIINKGETLFLPAILDVIKIDCISAKVLEVFL